MTHPYGLHAAFGVVTCLICVTTPHVLSVTETGGRSYGGVCCALCMLLWLCAVRCVCCCGLLQCVVYVVVARCSALCMLLWLVAVRCVCCCGLLQCAAVCCSVL